MFYRLDALQDGFINPITQCAYDGSWVVFMLTDSTEYQQFVGMDGSGVYTIKTSKVQYKDWKLAVGDVISFQETAGKNVLLVMPAEDFAEASEAYANHSSHERNLRENEPRVLVHSTTMENWYMIRRDGALKSWNRLKREAALNEKYPIGAELGDPADFRDYIMFGGGVTGEVVVHSKQTGKIVMDIDCEYCSGARLYFDAEKMARDGLLLRDGTHIKVKEYMPLEPYMLWAATWENIGISSQITTPRIFAERADRCFAAKFGLQA